MAAQRLAAPRRAVVELVAVAVLAVQWVPQEQQGLLELLERRVQRAQRVLLGLREPLGLPGRLVTIRIQNRLLNCLSN